MKLKIGLYTVLAGAMFFVACKKGENTPATQQVYEIQDQMARPAINTVFVGSADKDAFNTTIPSAMNAAFFNKFKTNFLALNPGYTTNALGQNVDQLIGLLVTDVLNVSLTAPKTTFFDGTNILTGRALGDDVIDVELLLLFGGPDGGSNPGLTSDKVNANDKPFLTTFPYLATAH